MKGNKSLYVLLPIVLSIWVLIGYRVIKYITPEEKTAIKTNSVIVPGDENIALDSFTIVANYRDPFLNGVPDESPPTPITTSSPHMRVATPVVKSEPPPLRIVYHGIVKNKDSNKTLAVLAINGKVKSVVEKGEVDGIKIMKVTRDSIITYYNKQTVVFKKK